jgi:uncharacterized membrane protein YhiD involved in acid resistance
MINFTDIIKGKFLEEFAAISMGSAVVAIGLSFLLSLFIVAVYRVTYAGVNYSSSFAGCLVMLSMVTTMVILVISSNVVLSLGMVGALSIVRFRTAVKEATDTAFLFWAIATGIICGAGYITISVLMTVLLGILFTLMYFLNKGHKSGAYMVVVRYTAESNVEDYLEQFHGYKLKNKTLSKSGTELVAEVRLGKNDMKQLDAFRNDPTVKELSVMASVSGSAL